MTMKITTILYHCLIDDISYAPDQRVAFHDEKADGVVQSGLAELTPDATGFTDHASNRVARSHDV